MENNGLKELGCTAQQKIGEGAFGTVYKCEWKGKIVAVKIINKLKLQEFMKKYVKQEILAMKEIKNKNCVQLYDYCEDINCIYIIMEFCNDNLLSYLRNRAQVGITEKEALTIFYDILQGMTAIHQKNYLHRDLKPENVLCQDGVFKICDFGFARKLEVGQKAKTFCGTDEFMAPEIMLHQEYDHQADVWSLGIILFVLVFFHYPFIGNQGGAMINVIENFCKNKEFSLQEILALPSRKKSLEKSQTLSPELIDLFKRLLTYDPARRITFSELHQHSAFNQLGKNLQPIRSQLIDYYQQNEKTLGVQKMQQEKEINKQTPQTQQQKLQYNEFDKVLLETDVQARSNSIMKPSAETDFKDISMIYQYEVNKYEFVYITLNKVKQCGSLSDFQNLICYYICKLSVFSIQQLMDGILKNLNPFKYTNWSNFVKSNSSMIILDKLKTDLKQMESELFNCYQIALDDTHKLDKQTKETIEQHITQTVIEQKFDDFKVPFRMTMITAEKLLENAAQKASNIDEKSYFVKLKLYIACCHVFNRIFERSGVIGFMSVFSSQYPQMSVFEFFNKFYKWIEESNIDTIQQQINLIWKKFF